MLSTLSFRYPGLFFGLTLVLVVALARSAPSPLSRPEKPVQAWELAGGYEWGGSWGDSGEPVPGWPIVLSSDGGYWCYWFDTVYVGRWELSSGKLRILERRADSPNQVLYLWLDLPVARSRQTGRVVIHYRNLVRAVERLRMPKGKG